MSTYECQEVTVNTNHDGELTFDFNMPVDKVMVSVNEPAFGANEALIGASARVVPDGNEPDITRRCIVRVFRSGSKPDSWSATPAADQQVTVTLLGIHG